MIRVQALVAVALNVLILMSVSSSPSKAQELLYDNFEQGAEDWAITPGHGDVRVSSQSAPINLQRTISQETFDIGQTLDQPFSTEVFARGKNAKQPTNQFSGRLQYAGGAMANFSLLKDDFNYASTSDTIASLPSFDIALVQTGDELVPVTRTPMAGAHRDWEWMFAPGRVWDAPDKKGWTRAALPFALMERNANCVHNGLATFRFDASGKISHFIYQIGSETCAYTQFNAWGAVQVTYISQQPANADETIAAYQNEKASRFETRSIESLPENVAKGFGSPEEVAPITMTVYGYVADNMQYSGGCETRFGFYIYCNSIIIPSYSWAKSLAAGIGAMRLEQLYPGAMQSLISDYVPACSVPRWQGVTFANTLDMASGVYNSQDHEADEHSADMRRFFLAETHAEKINIACRAFERNAAPGTKFVYRTGDTYILGFAINSFLRKKTGKIDADFYSDLLIPIWKKLRLSPVAMTIRRTYDGVRQPFSGWGMTLLPNDIALITSFLQRGGTIEDQQILDRVMLNAALQRDPGNRGLKAVFDTQRYQHGFWAWNAGLAIGCKGDIWIPAMSGYGGLSAALMPNGHVYYYISDGGTFAWRRAAQASNLLSPYCEEKP